MIILKLGGSVITKKADNKFEMNYEALNHAAKQIAESLKEDPSLQLFIVCGVGPFGHTNVKKYDINNGIHTKEQEEGLEITKRDCDFVGKETAIALEQQGLKTMFIPGYDVCVQENKKVLTYNFGPYEESVKENVIPITTGVMVPDNEMKWSVMSGDQAIAQLAKHFKPDKVLMGTDVDGIYTADPKEDQSAELLEKITKENLDSILEKVGESKAVDVTGGMKGKLEKLAATLQGTPAEIFNLFTVNNLKKSLKNEEIKSTKIHL